MVDHENGELAHRRPTPLPSRLDGQHLLYRQFERAQAPRWRRHGQYANQCPVLCRDLRSEWCAGDPGQPELRSEEV